MNLSSSDELFVLVSHHPDNNLLKIIWQGEIDATKLETGYLKALDIIKTCKVQRCLIDMSKRTLTGPGTEPVISDIFGQLLPLIREPMFVALVLSPENYFMMTDHFHYEYLKQDDNHYIIIKHFLKQEDALEWLRTAAESFQDN